MIQIRSGQFETNSSSCHVFCYRDEPVSVPSIVTFTPNSDATIKDIYFNDYYVYFKYDPFARYHRDDMIEFICKVLATGVEDIKCSDKRFESLVKEVKSNPEYDISRFASCRNAISHILFDEDVKLTTMEDFEVCPEAVEEKFGKGYHYIAHRLT